MDQNIFIKIKAAVVAIVGMFFAAFGWLGMLVMAWVCCMMADWMTGSAAAAKDGEWSSKIAREGIWHKGGMIVVVCVAGLADAVLGTVLGNLPGVTLPVEYTVLLCPIVLVWYIVTELGSILENATGMGAPVPSFLVKILASAKKGAEGIGDKAAEAVGAGGVPEDK